MEKYLKYKILINFIYIFYIIYIIFNYNLIQSINIIYLIKIISIIIITISTISLLCFFKNIKFNFFYFMLEIYVIPVAFIVIFQTKNLDALGFSLFGLFGIIFMCDNYCSETKIRLATYLFISTYIIIFMSIYKLFKLVKNKLIK